MEFEQGEPVTSDGSSQFFDVTATAPLPNGCRQLEESVLWRIRLFGRANRLVDVMSSGVHEILLTVDDPIEESSWGEWNGFALNRVRWLVENAGDSDDIDFIAESIQHAIDDFGIHNDGQTVGDDGRNPSELWALLDKTEKGQCSEGANLMELAMTLLGVEATFQFALPADELPVAIYSASNPTAAAPTRGPHSGTEHLHLYFTNAGVFSGLNEREGCCLVSGRLYTAFTAEHYIGTGGVEFDGTTTDSAAHHILLQLEREYRIYPRFQRWVQEPVENEVECPDATGVPVPRVQ